MPEHAWLALWISSVDLALALAGGGAIVAWHSGLRVRPALYVVPLIPSLLTLVSFVRVFVVGGGSNVAQLAGSSGMSLWSFWFHIWPLLILSNLAAVLIALIVLFLPLGTRRGWQMVIAGRLCSLSSALIALRFLGIYFPDA